MASAIEAFAERGYAGTSIQHILEATALSKPTLYYYFKSKADLFRAILDYAYDESFELLKAEVEKASTTEARLIATAVAWFAFANQHKNLMRLVLATNFAAPKEIPPNTIDHAKRRRHFDFLAAIVRHGQTEKYLDATHDTAELTHAILGSISHRIRTNLLSHDGKLDHALAERIVTIYLNGARANQ